MSAVDCVTVLSIHCATYLFAGTYAGLFSQVGCIPIMRTLYYNYSTMYYQHAT